MAAEVNRFSQRWKESASSGNLLSSFRFKSLGSQRGRYTLYQFDATRGFRVAFMRLDGDNDVYLIDCWKKTKQNNAVEVKRAKDRAQRFWQEKAGGSHG